MSVSNRNKSAGAERSQLQCLKKYSLVLQRSTDSNQNNDVTVRDFSADARMNKSYPPKSLPRQVAVTDKESTYEFGEYVDVKNNELSMELEPEFKSETSPNREKGDSAVPGARTSIKIYLNRSFSIDSENCDKIINTGDKIGGVENMTILTDAQEQDDISAKFRMCNITKTSCELVSDAQNESRYKNRWGNEDDTKQRKETSSTFDKIDVTEIRDTDKAGYNSLGDITRCRSGRKRVTFATDLRSLNLSAETRRMHFRNSYSKTSCESFTSLPTKIGFSFENRRNITKSPALEVRSSNIVDKSSTGFNNFTNKVLKRSQSAHAEAPRMTHIRPKRKLKSCRSRSFHRSLDNTNSVEICEILKSRRNTLQRNSSVGNVDVVTMVALLKHGDNKSNVELTQNESKRDKARIFFDAIQKNRKHDVANNNLRMHNANKSQLDKARIKTFDGNNTKRAVQKASVSSLRPEENSKLSDSVARVPEIREAKRPFVIRSHRPSESLDAPTSNTSQLNRSSTTTTESFKLHHQNHCNNVDEKNPNFDVGKEVECWESYKKMENKGVNVAFDTVLRGLLTPTEYRLRMEKCELIPINHQAI